MLNQVAYLRMRKLIKSYKTEINPTPEQKDKIHRTIGTCRYVYNFYISHNKELYENEKTFMTGKSFSVWLNNEFLPGNPELSWIKEVSSKAVKKSIENANTAFSKFFKHQSNFPRFKKKNKSDVKMYFVKTDAKSTIWCERHRIKIPTLGWLRLKKGEAAQRKNIQKQVLKVQRLHHRLDCVRTDYINKTIAEIVKTKPSHITIEDLNVRGMMKNRHLSKAVASQKFSEFRVKLESKCKENGIELRIVDRFYPSSKLCHCCGHINKELKLSDRVYRCNCGYVEDRDFNASLNLRDAETYKIA